MWAVLQNAAVITKKDLMAELRSGEILVTMAYFGIFVVLIFSFSFPVFTGTASREQVVGGILWISLAFAGSLGLNRAFDRERENSCIKALLLTPVPRVSIFLGKVFGMLLFILALLAVIVPAIFIFFNVTPTAGQFTRLALTLLLGTIGYAVVGTFIAAILMGAKSKDILLTIALFPILLPLIIAGVKATSLILAAQLQSPELAVWMKVLLTFDIIFTVVSLWIFETMILE